MEDASRSTGLRRFIGLFGDALLWVNSALFALLAYGCNLQNKRNVALPFAIAALLLFPPLRSFVRRASQRLLTTKQTIVVVFAAFLVGAVMLGSDNAALETRSETITFAADAKPTITYGASQAVEPRVVDNPTEKKAAFDAASSSDTASNVNNDIVTDVSLADVEARMNNFEATISDGPLVEINRLSNDVVFTRVFRLDGEATLVIVQNKRLAKVRDATLIWKRDDPEHALAGMLQLTGLIGAFFPEQSKAQRAKLTSEVIEGLKSDEPFNRVVEAYRISCSVSGAMMCSIGSRRMPLD